MRTHAIICIAVLLLATACGPGGNNVQLKTFLGGTEGITIEFDKNAPPKEVFDGGDFPFTVAVRLRNKGEYFVPKDLAKVTIAGIRAQEFNLRDADLIKAAPDDLIERKTDSAGKVIEPSDIFVEFNNMNHVTFITGNSLDFPIRAEVCYAYGTTAASSLCVRKNLADPEEGGLCDIESTRPLSVSGAPIRISEVREYRRGKDSVGFTFTVKNSGPGTGKVFNKGSLCEGGRTTEDRMLVNVKTDVPGLTCSNLATTREGVAEGTVQLFENSREITCQQKIPTTADYELPVTITLTYDYRDYAETSVTVKHSGTETAE